MRYSGNITHAIYDTKSYELITNGCVLEVITDDNHKYQIKYLRLAYHNIKLYFAIPKENVLIDPYHYVSRIEKNSRFGAVYSNTNKILSILGFANRSSKHYVYDNRIEFIEHNIRISSHDSHSNYKKKNLKVLKTEKWLEFNLYSDYKEYFTNFKLYEISSTDNRLYCGYGHSIASLMFLHYYFKYNI